MSITNSSAYANERADQGGHGTLPRLHEIAGGSTLTHDHLILEILPAMLFTSRPDGLWDYVNPPFCAYTGYSEEALTGMGWADALHADDRASSLIRWQTAIGRGTPLQVEHRLHGADGNHHWFRTHCTPQRNVAGVITRWVGIAMPVEIPPQMAVERQLRHSAELACDQVIAITAHELRAPMTVLLGQAQLLQRRLGAHTVVEPVHRHAVDTLVAQAIRLTRLINTLLDTAHIDHGLFLVSVITLDINALVRRVVHDLQPILPGHTLRLDADAGPLWVTGDAMRLEQVIQNLLQNAVTYSPTGSEIVIVVVHDGGHARIAVTDHGCGIAASVRPTLFQRFSHVRSGDGHAMSGLGLGLYISKAIMDLHGGSIEVESAVGAGSTFTLLLPRVNPPDSHGGHESS